MAEYARLDCPVSIGQDWTSEELEAAAQRGPHVFSLEPDDIAQIQIEAKDKEKQGFANIYSWEKLKQNLPPNLKLSPLAMIPHKSRTYRAILDLSFLLKISGYSIPSVNEATNKCAPEEAMNQLGSVLPRVIEALAFAPEDGGDIMMSKLDIADGFWRMVYKEGQEWNFAYILPNTPGKPIEIVVPSSLQMGWTLSPPFFCAAAETARDGAQTYVAKEIGSLPVHPLEHLTMPEEFALPEVSKMTGAQRESFVQLMESFVNDFMDLV